MYLLKGHVSPAPARQQRQVVHSDKWPHGFQEATEPWSQTAKTVAAHVSLSSSLMGPLNHRTTGVCSEESRCVSRVHSPYAPLSVTAHKRPRARGWLPVPHQGVSCICAIRSRNGCADQRAARSFQPSSRKTRLICAGCLLCCATLARFGSLL